MIRCEICRRELSQITWTHLSKSHNISLSEYKEKYPDSLITWNDGLTKENNPVYDKMYSLERNMKITKANILSWQDENIRNKRIAGILEDYKNNDQTERNKKISLGDKKAFLDPIKRANRLKHIYSGEHVFKAIREKGFHPENNFRVVPKFDEFLGHIIHSTWEANICRILKGLNVSYLYEPIRFDLGDCFYTPDLYLSDYGSFLEISGWRPDHKIYKINKLKELYPYIIIYELEAKGYYKLIKKFSQFIQQEEVM